MGKYLVKRVKKGSSPPPAAVVFSDVTDEDVVSAAGKLPGLMAIAGTLRAFLPEGWNAMDVATAGGMELTLHEAVIAVQSTTFGDENPKLVALGVAALRLSGLYESIVNVSLLALGRTRIDYGDNLRFVTTQMLSKEGMNQYKSAEVNAMIERIRDVGSIPFQLAGSWDLDSQVKYEWKKFVKVGSAFEYREAKAREAVREEVKKVIAAVARDYSVCGDMLGGHIGKCFIGADDDVYDEDGHDREQEVYDSDNYDSNGEYVGQGDDEDDGDSNW